MQYSHLEYLYITLVFYNLGGDMQETLGDCVQQVGAH